MQVKGLPTMAERPVTVFVHVHYPDIWQEMARTLADRLAFPFHLVLTHNGSGDALAIPQTPYLAGVDHLAVENRGRDVLPFLTALGMREDCDVGLKLHTKKSPQREDGALWRAEIIDTLLPVGQVAAVIGGIRADPRIGVVAPPRFCFSVAPWILLNAPPMIKVMARLGAVIIDSDLDDCYFAAGSMFWFRRTAIETLTTEPVGALFEPERGQLDGTIAHGMERLFPVEARRRGFVSLAVPALLASGASTPRDELLDLARRHADRYSSYFPDPASPGD